MARREERPEDAESYVGERPRPLTGRPPSEAPTRRRRPLSASGNEVRLAFTPEPGEGRREVLTRWKHARPRPRDQARGVGILLMAAGVLGIVDGASWLGAGVLTLGLIQTFDRIAVLGVDRRLREFG